MFTKPATAQHHTFQKNGRKVMVLKFLEQGWAGFIQMPFEYVLSPKSERSKPICQFQQHAECVAPILENFNYGGCYCPPRCDGLGSSKRSN